MAFPWSKALVHLSMTSSSCSIHHFHQFTCGGRQANPNIVAYSCIIHFYFDNLLAQVFVKLFLRQAAPVSVHRLNEASSDSERMCEREEV